MAPKNFERMFTLIEVCREKLFEKEQQMEKDFLPKNLKFSHLTVCCSVPVRSTNFVLAKLGCTIGVVEYLSAMKFDHCLFFLLYVY